MFTDNALYNHKFGGLEKLDILKERVKYLCPAFAAPEALYFIQNVGFIDSLRSRIIMNTKAYK